MSGVRVSIIIALIVAIALPISAQSDKIAVQRAKIATLEKQIAQSQSEAEKLRKSRSAHESQVRSLANQIEQRNQLIRVQQGQINILNDDIKLCNHNLDSLEVLFSQQRDAYSSMVRDAYRTYRQNTILSYIFTSEDFSDLSRRLVYVRSVARIRSERIERIRELSHEMEQQRDRLENSSQELTSTVDKLAKQRVNLEHNISSARSSISQMSRQEKQALAASQLKQKQLDSAISELQKMVKGNQQGASFSNKTSNLNLPVVGGKVKRYMDNMAEIVGSQGSKVISIYEGKVVEVKQNRITGNYDVYVAHGEYITTYAGLSAVMVSKGSSVTRNAALGVVGTAIDLTTMNSEYKIVFGIYPPNASTKMKASDCFKK
ncbi:MAG: peptidoglycan DD-metalloendopeptidase family protein [Rikenellaceae bacterium]